MRQMLVPFNDRPVTVIECDGEALIPAVLVERALGYAPTKLGRAIRRWESDGLIRPEHVRLILRSEVSSDLLTRQTSTPTLGVDPELLTRQTSVLTLGTDPDLDLTGRSDLLCLTERGVYRVLTLSRQAAALAFQDWMETQVLPAIRKTGSYGAPKPTPIADLAALALGRYAIEIAGTRYAVDRISKVARVVHAMLAMPDGGSVEGIRFYAGMHKFGVQWALHELKRHGFADDVASIREPACWKLTLDHLDARQIEATP